MQRQITQRELRNNSGSIMRALDAGESFLVTRNGVPVGQITPVRRRAFTSKEQALELFKTAPAVEFTRFRADLDALVEQSPEPRG